MHTHIMGRIHTQDKNVRADTMARGDNPCGATIDVDVIFSSRLARFRQMLPHACPSACSMMISRLRIPGQ